MRTLKIIGGAMVFNAALSMMAPAFAQEGRQDHLWVEEQNFVLDQQIKLQVGGLVSHYFDSAGVGANLHDVLGLDLDKKLGVFGYLQLGDYTQGYGGLALTLAPWLQCGLGLGPGNYGAWLWLGASHYSLFLTGNTNRKIIWYEANFKIQIDRVMAVGLMAQRFAGGGLRLEYHSPNTPQLTLWLAGLRNYEKGGWGGSGGIRWTFD